MKMYLEIQTSLVRRSTLCLASRVVSALSSWKTPTMKSSSWAVFLSTLTSVRPLMKMKKSTLQLGESWECLYGMCVHNYDDVCCHQSGQYVAILLTCLIRWVNWQGSSMKVARRTKPSSINSLTNFNMNRKNWRESSEFIVTTFCLVNT